MDGMIYVKSRGTVQVLDWRTLAWWKKYISLLRKIKLQSWIISIFSQGIHDSNEFWIIYFVMTVLHMYAQTSRRTVYMPFVHKHTYCINYWYSVYYCLIALVPAPTSQNSKSLTDKLDIRRSSLGTHLLISVYTTFIYRVMHIVPSLLSPFTLHVPAAPAAVDLKTRST